MPRMSLEQRRLRAAADLRGNADGVASADEVQALADDLAARPRADFDADASDRQSTAQSLATGAPAKGYATLDPKLRGLPEPMRRLALEIDALWGNADGEITVDKIDRVAAHYLAALPFFSHEASQLLDLARHLGFGVAEDPTDGAPIAPNVAALRAATAKLDPAEVAAGKPFRALLDQALVAADIPGAPELLRDRLRHSPEWHDLSILEHTTMAVRTADELARTVGLQWPKMGAVMLLHDVGKILGRVPRPDRGEHEFSYWDHEANGAAWLEARGVDQEIEFQVKNHMAVRPNDAEEILELTAGDKDRLARLLVVFCADDVAKGLPEKQVATFLAQEAKIVALGKLAGIDGQALFDRACAIREAWFADGSTDEP